MDLPAADLVHVAIPRGRDNALSLSAIAESVGLPRRTVEEAVRQLRLAGIAVASGSDGVWLGDLKDLQVTAKQLQSRLIAQYMTLRAVRSTQRRLQAGQTVQATLFGEAA